MSHFIQLSLNMSIPKEHKMTVAGGNKTVSVVHRTITRHFSPWSNALLQHLQCLMLFVDNKSRITLVPSAHVPHTHVAVPLGLKAFTSRCACCRQMAPMRSFPAPCYRSGWVLQEAVRHRCRHTKHQLKDVNNGSLVTRTSLWEINEFTAGNGEGAEEETAGLVAQSRCQMKMRGSEKTKCAPTQCPSTVLFAPR